MNMHIDLPFRRLMNVFFILFLVITGALVYWQVDTPYTKASSLVTSDYNPRHCVQDAIPQRGRILDRNGLVLAYSVADKSAPCGWRRYYHDPNHPEYTPAIESFAPMLGYFDPLGYGVTGLEAAYNDTLSGVTASAQATPDVPTGLQDALDKAEHLKTYGTDVYLTIDIAIQQKGLDSFGDGVLCHPTIPESQRGSIVVEDPHTGEMLAMVSHPGYSSERLVDHTPAGDGTGLTAGQEYFNQLLQDPDKPLIARPIADTPVPGSSFKTLTLIAAYDTGLFTPDSTFTKDESDAYTVDGFYYNVNNLIHYPGEPSSKIFPMDMTHQYAFSNNVAFERLAVGVGKVSWLDYAQRFGISYGTHVTNIPFDLPVAHSWVYQPQFQAQWDQDHVLLANTGFGQGDLQITPLEQSVILSAVAADGKYYRPHLLLKTVPHAMNAQAVPAIAPVLVNGKTMSPSAAQGVRQAMRAVVTIGSVGVSGGRIAALRDSPALIGGKTGTGEVGPGVQPQTWFISLAPDDTTNPTGNAPRVTVVVQKEQDGEGACQAPIAKDVIEFTLPRLGFPINLGG